MRDKARRETGRGLLRDHRPASTAVVGPDRFLLMGAASGGETAADDRRSASGERSRQRASDLPPLLDLPAVLDTEELARVLHISVIHCRRILARGTIPSCRIGRRRLVLRETLLRLLRPERAIGTRTPAKGAGGVPISEEEV